MVPYVIEGQIYFCPVVSFYLLSSSSFFSSPNLSGHRLDVYHTSTHGVALVLPTSKKRYIWTMNYWHSPCTGPAWCRQSQGWRTSSQPGAFAGQHRQEVAWRDSTLCRSRPDAGTWRTWSKLPQNAATFNINNELTVQTSLQTSSSAIAERPQDARVTSIRKTAKWNFWATLLRGLGEM